MVLQLRVMSIWAPWLCRFDLIYDRDALVGHPFHCQSCTLRWLSHWMPGSSLEHSSHSSWVSSTGTSLA